MFRLLAQMMKNGKGSILRKRGGQRLLFFMVALMFASLPTYLFANFLWRVGITDGSWLLTSLFAVLSWNVAWGATHAVVGFFRRRSSLSGDGKKPPPAQDPGNVAIVLPVYNEEPSRVFAGLRTMFESLRKTGRSDAFDFFILSDSTKPERWIQEEFLWTRLCRDLEAFGQIHYRRRKVNTDKKAGNLLEFCEKWGSRYRYMITLDADSVMTGETVLALYDRMEAHSRIGILQTVPRIVYAESFWGRLQQFSNEFYGPIFVAGLDFWQGSEGNYWGHNAIIRLAPFMEFCALPDLPGREPFGGKILSHDFVEAALMQRGGYDVCLASDLTGSYEECPQDLIEHAKRDRRWCQGNMQHFWLLFSKGLTFASRLHLANGIMGYLSSLLWASFLILSGIFAYNRVRSDLTLMPTDGLGNLLPLPLQIHGLLVFCFTFSLLLLPKGLAWLDSILTAERSSKFGGKVRSGASVLLELFSSAAVAPIMMLYHAQFVVTTALGKGVGWSTQNRVAGDGLTLTDAFRAHFPHFVVGVVGTFFATKVNDVFLYWTLPVTGAMMASPIVSWILSKPSIGRRLRSIDIFVTPTETEDSVELSALGGYEAEFKDLGFADASESTAGALMHAVIDPYVNAIRVSLAKQQEEGSGEDSGNNRAAALLRDGLEGLSQEECEEILHDVTLLNSLHRHVWTQAPRSLHISWRVCLERYQWERPTAIA